MRLKTRTAQAGLACAALLAATAPLPAQQETAPADRDDSSTVVLERFVTVASSSDRANNILDPNAKAAVTPAASVIDLMQSLPGVLINEGDAYGGDDWSTRIYVRGFQAGQLGFSIDGIPTGNTNYGGGTKPNRFIDPENVSLLSVSQGSGDVTAAGSQALGGTFEYATVSPTAKPGLASSITAGQNQLLRAFARLNTGQLAGNTSAYVSVSNQTHHRWMDNGGSVAETKRTHVDAKSVTTFGKLTATTRFSYDDINEPNYDSVTLADYAVTPQWDGLTGQWTGRPNDDQNYISGWNTIRKNSLLGLDFSLQATDSLRLKVSPYWQHQKGSGGWLPPYWRSGWDASGNPVSNAEYAKAEARVFFVDASGNPLYVLSSGTAPAGVTFYTPSNPFDIGAYPASVQKGAVAVQSYRTSTYLFDRIGSSFGGELKTGELNKLQFGGWYENLHREPGRTWHKVLDTRVGWTPADGYYWTDFLSDLKTKTLQLYVQDTVRWNAFSFTGGLRKYLVDLDYSDQYGVRASRSLDSDSQLLPSAGAVYRLGEGYGELFGGYSKNFKAIEDNILAGTGDISKSLEPETSDSFDFGYRRSGRRYSGSVSAYYIDFNNRIESVPPYNGGVTGINYDIGQNGGYVNVGGIRSKGVELAGSAQLTTKLSTSASLTFNRSEYSANVPENNVVEGHRVTGTPERMATAALHYADGPYHASLGAKYTGRRYGTLDNKETIGGYTLYDLTLGYRRSFPFATMGVDLRVQNLFDKRYLSGLDGDANKSTGYYFIGFPRTTSITVSLEF